MKALPYFKWYPADADTDQNFRAMDDSDIGFYIRCLNHAWINGGIPSDPKERARVLRTRLDIANKRWERVGKCFVPSTSMPEQLINFRQETERGLAREKSLKAAASVNNRYERKANESPRALTRAVSDSVSTSFPEVIPFIAKPKNGKPSAAIVARFDEWIKKWPRNPEPEKALHAFVFCWTPETDEEIFACRDRFLASKDAAEGVCQNPDKFLNEQKHNNWAGRWPGRAKTPAKESLVDRTMTMLEDRISKGQRPI